MKAFRYFLLALAVIVVGAIATPALQQFTNVSFVKGVADYAINDEIPVILIKYVGTSASGTLDMATSALEFKVGVVASEAFPSNDVADDVNFGNACGSVTGSLDLTDAGCDTFGELVEVINGASNTAWVAVLVGALAGDSIAAGSDFIDPADKLCKQPGGCVMFADASVHDELHILFAPWVDETFDGVSAGLAGIENIEPFLTRGMFGSTPQVLKGNPIPQNYVPALQFWFANINGNASGGNFEVYSLKYADELGANDGTAVERLLYTVTLADDTELTSSVNWLLSPLYGDPGTILLIRGNFATNGDVTDTDDEIQFAGYYFSVGN